jgi:translation initiation factor IF-2
MRVYEVAKELGIESKEAVRLLNEIGVEVKSHANAISDEDAQKLRNHMAGDAEPEAPAAAPEEAPAEAVAEEPQPEPAEAEAPEAEAVEAEAAEESDAAAEEEAPAPAEATRVVEISMPITVGGLAEAIDVSGAELIKDLMGRGVMANMNQTLEADVASDVAAAFGVLIETRVEEEGADLLGEVEAGDDADLETRAPVVTIMGHVDHGKTQLLDSIRETNVVAREAGGITQHIGASEVDWQGNRIVFIDTPGHEAFTRMRARGADVTDLVVLVVAANDGIMPQTVEAIDHARAANVPIIVAINKIDLPEANPERVKQQLLEHNLTPEDWGGDTVCVEVSALQKQNLDGLLEMIVLSADLLELKANPSVRARGTVLEAELDRRRGAVATVLVQQGTLRVGDSLIAGVEDAKVRAMIDAYGAQVKEAGPATGVEVLGFSGVPAAGDEFQVVEAASVARQVAELRQQRKREDSLVEGTRLTLEDLHERLREGERVTLPVIVKGDTQGSVETLRDALTKLSGDSVEVEILRSAVGGVSETDVLMASASNAIIVGFNVRPERGVADAAEREGVDIRLHTIIYQLLDEVKQAMVGQLSPTFEEETLGAAEVRDTFRIPRAGTIAGCYITDGKIFRDAKARLVRDSRIIYDGQVRSLRRFKEDVAEVQQGYECGIALENFNDVKVGDVIEAYKVKEIAPSL